MSGPVKPVFSSPTGLNAETVGASISSSSAIDGFIQRHSFPDDVSKALSSVQREEHVRRMKNLRKELEYIDKTNWQFEPIEKLLGQS